MKVTSHILYRILFIFIIGIVGASVHAEEFKGPVLWDASGQVKKLEYKTKNPIMSKKGISFTEDGKIKNSMMVYDGKGYPVGFDLTTGVAAISVNIQYTTEMHPDFITVKSSMFSDGTMEIHFKYVDGVLEGMECRKVTDKSAENLIFKFSNYVYDGNGNWICRDVSLTSDKDKEKTKQYTETRKIQYYE